MDSEFDARLRAVEDRLAILQLEGAYARLFDSRRGEEWASLFTEDGTYEVRELPGRAASLRRGHEELARLCNKVPVSGLHLMNVPHLTIDSDRATARVHFSFHSEAKTSDSSVEHGSVLGYYDVAYVRVEGEWRIRRRATTWFRNSVVSGYGYDPVGAFEGGEPAA